MNVVRRRRAYHEDENEHERELRLTLRVLRFGWGMSTLSAMSKTRSEVLEESRKKGIVAGATTAGAVAASVLVSATAGAVVAVPAAYLAYKWWKHRAENGIRF